MNERESYEASKAREEAEERDRKENPPGLLQRMGEVGREVADFYKEFVNGLDTEPF